MVGLVDVRHEKKEIDPFLTDNIGKCQKLSEGVKMLLVCIGSI